MAGENVVSIVVKADNATGAGFDEATASAEELAAKVDEAMSDYVDAVEKAQEASARLAEMQKDDSASADDLAAAQDRVTSATLLSLDAQTRLIEAERAEAGATAEAGDAQEDLAVKTDATAASSEESAGLMAGFGSKAKLALLGVGAAMVYGAVKAAEFQSQLLTLHTQAGVATSQLKSLGNGVLDLAGQVGDSPDSLVEALYHVESSFASVGIKGPQALNLLKIAAEGAAVGHANLTDVTNALDATIVSGVPGIKSFSGAMGDLNAIVGSGDMTMQNLADAMGTGVMAVAKSYGQNITQVGAALALFGDNNIRGAHAATELRMAWQAMQAPLTTAGPVSKGIGLTMTELGHTMTHQGMNVAIEQFIDHLKASKVPVDDWGQMMTEIFGKKAGVGIGIMVDQIGRLNSKFPDLEKGAAGFGDAWKDQQQTVAQQWKDLTSGLDALAVKMGEVFLPVAMKAVKGLTEFAGWLTRNKDAAYALGAVVAGSLAVIIGGKLVESAEGAAEAFRSLGESELLSGAASKIAAAGQWLLNAAMDANPVMLVVLAIAALVGGFILLWEKSAAFRNFWEGLWKDISKPVIKAFDEIKDAITGGFDSWWKSHGKELEEVWKTAWTVIRDVFKVVWDYISTVTKIEWAIMMAVLKPGLDLLVMYFKVAWAEISAVVKIAFDVIAAVVKIAFAGILLVVKTAWDVIVGIFDIALDLITGHWSKAWTDLQTMLKQVWNNIKQYFGSVWGAISALVVQVLHNIEGFFSAAWSAIKGGVTSAFSDILGWFGGLPGRILSALSALPGMMFRAGVNVIKSLLSGITSMIGDIGSTMGHIASKVAGFFGLSPAKEGPLSGGGAPEIRGAHFSEAFAQGMLSRQAAIGAAAHRLAGSAGIGGGSGSGSAAAGGSSGGQMTLQFQLGSGASGLEQMWWTWFKNGLRAQGGDPRIVNRKVVFQ